MMFQDILQLVIFFFSLLLVVAAVMMAILGMVNRNLLMSLITVALVCVIIWLQRISAYLDGVSR
jgi:hypothetical protein